MPRKKKDDTDWDNAEVEKEEDKPEKGGKKGKADAMVTANRQRCRYGIRCVKPDCTDVHPWEADWVESEEKKDDAVEDKSKGKKDKGKGKKGKGEDSDDDVPPAKSTAPAAAPAEGGMSRTALKAAKRAAKKGSACGRKDGGAFKAAKCAAKKYGAGGGTDEGSSDEEVEVAQPAGDIGVSSIDVSSEEEEDDDSEEEDEKPKFGANESRASAKKDRRAKGKSKLSKVLRSQGYSEEHDAGASEEHDAGDAGESEDPALSDHSSGLVAHESAAATIHEMDLALAPQGASRRPAQEILLPKEPVYLPIEDQIKDDAAAALGHQGSSALPQMFSQMRIILDRKTAVKKGREGLVEGPRGARRGSSHAWLRYCNTSQLSMHIDRWTL